MMRIFQFAVLIFFITNCSTESSEQFIVIKGEALKDSKFMTLGSDTIEIIDGQFSDTFPIKNAQYKYLQLDAWKWGRIVYLVPNGTLNLDFREELIDAGDDLLNSYLLNRDLNLIQYTASWKAEEAEFNATWNKEFSHNIQKIDDYFEGSGVDQSLVDEVKQMEYFQRAHRTANYKSFQKRFDVIVHDSIYSFVDSMDLHNERLAFHKNNRNFQYYYFLDKIDSDLPDSIYPFAAIDTLNNNVQILDIREMIISSVVRSGLYDESVDHDALFDAYKANVRNAKEGDDIFSIYDQIQSLKKGRVAPSIGSLTSLSGEKLSLENFKGQNILLSVWGTWCPFCQEELPHLKSLMKDHGDKFESVAISFDTDAVKWTKYIEENDWGGTHLISPNKKSTFKSNYLASGTNIYYLIGKDGKILMNNDMKPSHEELEILISEL